MNQPGDKFFAAILTANKVPQLKSYATIEELAEAVGNMPHDVQGFLFHGEQIRVSKAPWRFLMFGDRTVPTFSHPVPTGEDDTAGLGMADKRSVVGRIYRDAAAAAVAEDNELHAEVEGEDDE